MQVREFLVFSLSFVFILCVSSLLNAKTPVSMEERIEAGKGLFQSKNCSYCHSIHGEGGNAGPDLAKWESLESPVLWAAIMWNHVPDMIKTYNEKKIDYPDFEGEEIAYIFEYIHSVSEQKGGTIAFPGDENTGAFFFQYLGCKQCHAINDDGGELGPDLANVASMVKSDGEFAGLMIKHAPYMSRHAEMQRMLWPKLQGNEMAHLFVYFKSLKK